MVAPARFCFSLPATAIVATVLSLPTPSHGPPYWPTLNRQLVPTQSATAIATARATVPSSLALSLARILGMGLNSPAVASPTCSYRISPEGDGVGVRGI